MDQYKKALRENVCEICADSNEKGFCTLDKNESCSLQLHSQKIVDIIHSIKDGTYQQYYNALKEQICDTHCILSDNDRCSLSDDANCSIDRYTTLIIDTIHQVDKKLST